MILVNNIDCNALIKNVGLKGCSINPGYFPKILLAEKGFYWNSATDTISQEAIDALIQTNVLLPLPVHSNIVPTVEDPVYETFGSSGARAFVRDNPIFLLVEWSGVSTCFGNALSTLEAKKWDVFLVDSANLLWGAETIDGKFKPFDGELFVKLRPSFNDGSVSFKERAVIDLSPVGSDEFTDSRGFVKSDVNFLGLNGVNDVIITPTSTLASNFKVTVTIGCDKSTKVTGLADPAFWEVKDAAGDLVTVTIAYTNGEYVISGLTAGTAYTISLGDSTNGYEIINVEGEMYNSNTISVTPS